MLNRKHTFGLKWHLWNIYIAIYITLFTNKIIAVPQCSFFSITTFTVFPIRQKREIYMLLNACGYGFPRELWAKICLTKQLCAYCVSITYSSVKTNKSATSQTSRRSPLCNAHTNRCYMHSDPLCEINRVVIQQEGNDNPHPISTAVPFVTVVFVLILVLPSSIGCVKCHLL